MQFLDAAIPGGVLNTVQVRQADKSIQFQGFELLLEWRNKFYTNLFEIFHWAHSGRRGLSSGAESWAKVARNVTERQPKQQRERTSLTPLSSCPRPFLLLLTLKCD